MVKDDDCPLINYYYLVLSLLLLLLLLKQRGKSGINTSMCNSGRVFVCVCGGGAAKLDENSLLWGCSADWSGVS